MYAWVLLAALAAVALADWFAVATGRRGVEQVAKPAYVVLLGAFAWLLHADETVSGLWLLMGLALCLGGDLLLLADSDRAFGFGLVTFLLAHVAFIGAVMTMSRRPPVWVGVAVDGGSGGRRRGVRALAAGATGHRPRAFRRRSTRSSSARSSPSPGGRDSSSSASGRRCSSSATACCALGRFWRELPGLPVAVMVTYHLALLFLVVGVLRPDLVAP